MLFVLWFLFWYLGFSGLGNTVRSKNLLDLVLYVLHLIHLNGRFGIPTTYLVALFFHMLLVLSNATVQNFLLLILGDMISVSLLPLSVSYSCLKTVSSS